MPTTPPPFTLTITAPPTGLVSINAIDKMHPSRRYAQKKAWRELARIHGLNWLRAHPHHHALQAATITYVIHHTHHRPSDADNFVTTTKAIRDGLTHAGIFPDDSDDYILATTYIRGATQATPAIAVHITPLGPGDTPPPHWAPRRGAHTPAYLTTV